jgi:hypothetical protein
LLTKTFRIKFEINGIETGRASEESYIYILPLSGDRAPGTVSLPHYPAESILEGSLHLGSEGILDKNLLSTGLFTCVFTLSLPPKPADLAPFVEYISRFTSRVDDSGGCELPPSAFDNQGCLLLAVSLSYEDASWEVSIQNKFLRCGMPVLVLEAHPQLLIHGGADFNASIKLTLSQKLEPAIQSYTCLVKYTLHGGVTEAYPLDLHTLSCPVRVAAMYGGVDRMALALGDAGAALVVLDQNSPFLPYILFELPKVTFTGQSWLLVPHGLPNRLPFRLIMPSANGRSLKELLIRRQLRLVAQFVDLAQPYSTTEVVISLDAVLEEPAFVFEV